MKRRLLVLLPSLAFATILSFVVINSAPGDPLAAFMPDPEDASRGGITDTKSYREALSRKLELDLPVFYFSVTPLSENRDDWKHWIPVLRTHPDNRFQRWLFGNGDEYRGILRGDLGYSWQYRQKVSALILPRLAWSLGLSMTSLILSFLLSIPAGLHAAGSAGSRYDRFLKSFTVVIMSLPAFWIAILLIMTFANPDVLGWLPAAGGAPSRVEHPTFFQRIPYLILPTLTYVISSMAFLARGIRDAAIAELKSGQVRTARSKGLHEKRILYVHVLRTQAAALLTVFGQAVPVAISGSVIIETVFSLPSGMGSLITSSVYSLDYPVLTAIFLLTALVTLSVQLIIDLLIARIDPRTANALLESNGHKN